MRAKINNIIFIIFTVALLVGSLCYHQITIDASYRNAIISIENGSYDAALDALEKANIHVTDQYSFQNDMKFGKLKKCYKDTIPLYAYVLAKQEYDSLGSNPETVYEYLEMIPESYSGELSEEINTFKQNFKPQYEEYLVEKKKKEEEQELKQLKESLPYVGMSESNIGNTMLGKKYEVRSGYEWEAGEKIPVNIYYFKKGNAIIFVVKCMRGRAFYVADDRNKPWVYPSDNSYQNRSHNDNPYNVNDYDTPEEFYEDNLSRFWDEDEAIHFYNHYRD